MNKIELTVLIEVLSVDTISGVLADLKNQIDGEKTTGELHYDDGDCVKWSISRRNVSI